MSNPHRATSGGSDCSAAPSRGPHRSQVGHRLQGHGGPRTVGTGRFSSVVRLRARSFRQADADRYLPIGQENLASFCGKSPKVARRTVSRMLCTRDAQLRGDVQTRVHHDFRPRHVAVDARIAQSPSARAFLRAPRCAVRSTSAGSLPTTYNVTSRPPPSDALEADVRVRNLMSSGLMAFASHFLGAQLALRRAVPW